MGGCGRKDADLATGRAVAREKEDEDAKGGERKERDEHRWTRSSLRKKRNLPRTVHM